MFLPISKEDMEERGWAQADFVLVTGDAYVDHPSFGTAIISRVLESYGYKIAVLAQPGWQTCADFTRFGKPRLGFLINSGSVDSMVNHFSVFKNRRKRDAYSPGGRAGCRPDRAVIVYSNRAREAYRDVPVLIGGLEASLRRLGHYDYWDDRVRRSVLLDAKADLLLYGMGERAAIEIAEALDAGIPASQIGWVRGTCVKAREISLDEDTVLLPGFPEIQHSKEAYCDSFALQYGNQDSHTGKRLIEPYGGHAFVVENPAQPPLNREELDQVYELPYERDYHPVYEKEGGVPAAEEVKFSLTSSRGCFGGCSFCALTYHQGREVSSRSRESLVREGAALTRRADFKGYIHDVGGPTANFRGPACQKQQETGTCSHRDCLYPRPCPRLEIDHRDYLEVLRAIRGLDHVKKVFIRSGIRHDYLMADQNDDFLWELCRYHVSGTLKVAPEHVSPRVLACMRKPPIEVFLAFREKFQSVNAALGVKQYLIPYLISSHPGSTLEDAVELALFLKDAGFVPDQVQDFYPTPGTLATCMYYAERDPFTKEPVYVAKTIREKKLQRALIHFRKQPNRRLVKEALLQAGRPDLLPALLPAEHEKGKKK